MTLAKTVVYSFGSMFPSNLSPVAERATIHPNDPIRDKANACTRLDDETTCWENELGGTQSGLDLPLGNNTPKVSKPESFHAFASVFRREISCSPLDLEGFCPPVCSDSARNAAAKSQRPMSQNETKARPAGLEPATLGSEDRYSIQLSYGRNA